MQIKNRAENNYLEFKDSRLEREWFAGADPESPETRSIHPALRVLVNAAAHWHYRRSGRRAVLTDLFRTRTEQERIYPGEPERRSPHEFGRAADLRATDLKGDAAREWESWINAAFVYLGRPGARSALLHEVGSHGRHLHLQVGPAEPRPGPAAEESTT